MTTQPALTPPLEPGPAGAGTGSDWSHMRIWALAHTAIDFFQGAVPAAIPYFVLDRHYSYLQASGLSLAATLGAAIPQPLFGVFVDRRDRPWQVYSGISLAAAAAAAAGIAHAYALTWGLLLLCGIGVAMFHPAAGRLARRSAGNSAAAMSIFATGGNLGFVLAPVLLTPVLAGVGLWGLAWFVMPAWLVALVTWRGARRVTKIHASSGAEHHGRDHWRPFMHLAAVEICRSVMFFGASTFIELYWIRDLHAGKPLAGAALGCLLGGGVIGTMLGGRIADRLGMVRTTQVGALLCLPAMVLLRACQQPELGLVCALIAGLALRVPFSVLIKLGQDYLPNRPGTASAVTLGLAVSAGGISAPVFGALADARGPATVLTLLCLVPILTFLVGVRLVEPAELVEPPTVASG
ncbi:MAG TPA: MFS transporter [Solirubrobacteraceae bacterium]|nr:MFS transporter [Solirubrobacteraceae bacterium]